MLKLSELKISPWPWKVNDHTAVLDRDSVIISGQYGPYNWSNARLEAAAPDMYDALQRIVQASDDSAQDFPSWQKNLRKALIDARAALAKAAGEDVAK